MKRTVYHKKSPAFYHWLALAILSAGWLLALFLSRKLALPFLPLVFLFTAASLAVIASMPAR